MAQSEQAGLWVVPIRGEITSATAQFVRSRIDQANEALPLALVFVIDTPGGSVDAADNISASLLRRAQVPTIAVVERAISAGALIAMSAEELVMLTGSEIGAATAINIITGEAADEKIQSVWRSQFRSVAEARGRNVQVAEGMVEPGIEVPGIATSEELVTLTAGQAVEQNVANAQANSLREALDDLGYAGVSTLWLEPTATERAASWLTRPLMAAALLSIGLLGILIEIFTPGFGVPGGLGIVALLLFFGSAFVATPAGVFDVVLLLAGVVLLALEILVIPGFGVAGILGIAAIGYSTFRIFQQDFVSVFGYTVLFVGAMIALALWFFPKRQVSGFLTLTTTLAGDGTSSAAGAGGRSDPAQAKLTNSLEHFGGMRGTALSDLRPAGVAQLGDERVDVVTRGDYIRRGTGIEVVKVEGNRVTVQALEEV